MALVVRALVKSYGTKTVLHGVDLDVADGEIHALLGPNGSGKSTLIGCLSGSIRPDSGRIEVAGVTYRSLTPRAAIQTGTATIYQHFSLVPTLSVTDNLFLGEETRRGGRIDRAAESRVTAHLLAPFERPITPATIVGNLSTGDRQLVEIAKALRHRPSLLILDEPTAALGESEVGRLMTILRRLRGEGLAILYVTHLLPEVFALADRVTVLRDGGVVLARPVADLDQAQVIAALAPKMRVDPRFEAPSRPQDSPAALAVNGLRIGWVGPVEFTLRRGEVLGIFGLLGSGRTEILEAIYGIGRIAAGTIAVNGRPFRPRRPSDALRRGIALVPTDRLRQGILDRLTALDNIELPHVARLAVRLFRRRDRERSEFEQVASRLSLIPDDPDALAWTFSGGNQQKLVVGRWLSPSRRIEVLLLDEPTQGIDVGARADLYRLVRQLAGEDGSSVLFTSSDPQETIALADRVMVLRRGRVIAELDRSAMNERNLLALAHGAEDPRSLGAA
jgi:ribose transport system ATP-binding protein